MLTSGLGASEKSVSLFYLNVDKKHKNVKPKLFCYRYLVQLCAKYVFDNFEVITIYSEYYIYYSTRKIKR